jgi:NADH:ubiquinone oxidoreductase subunit 6 (subunit J)
VGVATIVVFLMTGVYLRWRVPALYGDDAVIHSLFRANHVYILLSGLINLGIGTYVVLHGSRWRRNLQLAGSCLLLAAPVVLLLAFIFEPPRATPARYVTAVGVLILFLGVLCHAMHRTSRRRSKQESPTTPQ